GNGLKARGAVVHGVEGAHVGQKGLGRADVARRLLAADVLLARLQGEAQGPVVEAVLGDANDAAGYFALVLVGTGEEARVGPAVTERHAEALGAADGDVGAELAGRLEPRQGQEVGGDAEETLPLVHEVRELLV